MGREHTRAVAGMTPGFLDVLHDPTNDAALAVGNAIDIDLDGIFEKLVDQNCLRPGLMRRLESARCKELELEPRVRDHHGSTAKHVAGSHADWQPHALGHGHGV